MTTVKLGAHCTCDLDSLVGTRLLVQVSGSPRKIGWSGIDPRRIQCLSNGGSSTTRAAWAPGESAGRARMSAEIVDGVAAVGVGSGRTLRGDGIRRSSQGRGPRSV